LAEVAATECFLVSIILFSVPSVEKIPRVKSYKNLKQNSWMAITTSLTIIIIIIIINYKINTATVMKV